MLAEQQNYIVDFNRLIVEDQKRVRKYLSFYNDFYIPPRERHTLNESLNKNLVYIKSLKKINYQLDPIYVAVNDYDKWKDDKVKPYRIHLRILSGRNRWEQSMISGMRWKKVVFMDIQDFEHFIEVFLEFGEKKHNEIYDKGKQKVSDFKEKIEQLGDYLCDEKGYLPSNVAPELVRRYGNNHPYSDSQMYRLISPRFKNQIQIKVNSENSALGKKTTRFKKDKLLNVKDQQITGLLNRVWTLETNALPPDKKMQLIENLQDDKKKLTTKNMVLVDEIRSMTCFTCGRPVKNHTEIGSDISLYGYAAGKLCREKIKL